MAQLSPEDVACGFHEASFLPTDFLTVEPSAQGSPGVFMGLLQQKQDNLACLGRCHRVKLTAPLTLFESNISRLAISFQTPFSGSFCVVIVPPLLALLQSLRRIHIRMTAAIQKPRVCVIGAGKCRPIPRRIKAICLTLSTPCRALRAAGSEGVSLRRI